MICPSCNRWEPLEVDRFCSYCGQQLRGLKFWLKGGYEPAQGGSAEDGNQSESTTGNAVNETGVVEFSPDEYQVYLNERDDNERDDAARNAWLELWVENVGAQPAQVTEIELQQMGDGEEWLMIEPFPSVTLGSRQTHMQRLNLIPVRDVLNAVGRYTFKVFTDKSSDAEAQLSITAAIRPRWEFEWQKRPIVIIVDGIDDEETGADIEVSAGTLTIRDIQCSIEDARIEFVDPGADLPLVLDSRGQHKTSFRLSFNERAWEQLSLQESEKSQLIPFSVTVELDGIGSHTFENDVRLLRPKQLEVHEKASGIPVINIAPGMQKKVRLTCSNRGDGFITITDVQFQGHNGGKCKWLSRNQPRELPWQIGPYSPDKLQVLELLVSADGLASGSTLRADVTIKTDSQLEPDILFPVIAEVRELPVVDDPLIIDFGTTATTIRCNQHDGNMLEYEPVSFRINEVYGEVNDDAIIPSALFYRRWRTDERDYYAGREAQIRVMRGRNTNSGIINFKMHMGLDHLPNSISLRTSVDGDILDRTPKDILKDYLCKLFGVIESTTEKRYKYAVATVPATFTHLPIDQYRNVMSELGFEDVAFISEPVAAAMEYLVGDRRDILMDMLHNRRTATLLVFDSGGGTTDVTLMKVEYDNEYLNIDIIGLIGEDRFAGEWITEDVKNYFMSQIQEACQEFDLVLEAEAHLTMSSSRYEEVRERLAAVRNFADAAKRTLSDKDEWRRSDVASEMEDLRVRDKQDVLLNIFAIRDFDLRIKRQEFEQIIDRRMDQPLKLILALLEEKDLNVMEGHPNLVIATGRNTYLKHVRRKLKETFPNSQHEWPEKNLKGCVSDGAAAYVYRLEYGVDEGCINVHFPESLNLTTARYGVVSVDRRRRFRQIIPASAEIGEDIWHLVRRGVGKRLRMTILENRGMNDDLYVIDENGEQIMNPDIREVAGGIFDFNELPLRDRPKTMIEMCIDKNYVIHLRARVPDDEDKTIELTSSQTTAHA